jgi:hypothetical protein
MRPASGCGTIFHGFRSALRQKAVVPTTDHPNAASSKMFPLFWHFCLSAGRRFRGSVVPPRPWQLRFAVSKLPKDKR